MAPDLRRAGQGLGRRPRDRRRGRLRTGLRRDLRRARLGREGARRLGGAALDVYRKIRVRVQTLDGDALCWMYVLDDYEGGLPSARYLGILADAAEKAAPPTTTSRSCAHVPASRWATDRRWRDGAAVVSAV
ncbi:gamma-glutamylcyclotransferase [Actinomadura luteofluorescens]